MNKTEIYNVGQLIGLHAVIGDAASILDAINFDGDSVLDYERELTTIKGRLLELHTIAATQINKLIEGDVDHEC